MSTVYYLRYNICDFCDRYDEIRVCKFSGGNPPLIYGIKNLYVDKYTRDINITSYSELQNAIECGIFTLFDEYNREINPTAFYDNFEYFRQFGEEKVIIESEIKL